MARTDRIIKLHLRERMLITTKSGQSWSALVIDADDKTFVLANVEAVGPDGTHTKADGQVFLPRGDVAYMQKI